jgi:hypothetical protein
VPRVRRLSGGHHPPLQLHSGNAHLARAQRKDQGGGAGSDLNNPYDVIILKIFSPKNWTTIVCYEIEIRWILVFKMSYKIVSYGQVLDCGTQLEQLLFGSYNSILGRTTQLGYFLQTDL